MGAAQSETPPGPGVRLQRWLADAGVAARRRCEDLIREGRVRVNGRVVRTIPAFVDPGADRVEVDGRPVSAAGRRVYLMFHKPERVLTVLSDEPGAARRTVVDLVRHPSGARVFPVGRLEYDASGLVLLTNDGDLAARLAHPRYEVPREYRVVVRGTVDEASLSRVTREVAKAGRRDARRRGRLHAAPVEFGVIERADGRTVLRVLLRGRSSQVRPLLARSGFPVRKLEQVALGPLRLTGVARGRWRDLDRGEVYALRRAVRSNEGGSERAAAGGSRSPGRTRGAAGGSPETEP